MSLRKPTQMLRRTVDETGRVLVHPEPDAPAGSTRRIQVILPQSPQVVMALGPHPQGVDPAHGEIEGIDNSGATPADIAHGRHYQWAEPDSGAYYDFSVGPDQWLAVAATEGIAKVTVIVEYHVAGA